MVKEKYAPGMLEIGRMGGDVWTEAMELFNKEFAEGDVGAGGGERADREE